MLQYAGEFRRHRVQAADWNAEFAIIERTRPRRSVGDVKKGLLGIERHQNVVAGWSAEVACQIVVVGFERSHNLSTERVGSLLAFVMQNKMTAFSLGEVGLDVLFALRLSQELLDRRVGTQLERMFPRGNSFLGTIRGELSVAQHSVRVGRLRCRANGALGKGKRLCGIAGPHQECSIINEDRRVLRLEAQGALKIKASLSDVPVFKFELSGDEVGRSAQFGIALAFQTRKRTGIDLTVFDDLGGKVPFVSEAVRGRESGQVADSFRGAAGGRKVRRHATRVDMVYKRFRDRVRIIANVVLVVTSAFADVVGQDGSAVFQMNSVRPCGSGGERHPY